MARAGRSSRRRSRAGSTGSPPSPRSGLRVGRPRRSSAASRMTREEIDSLAVQAARDLGIRLGLEGVVGFDIVYEIVRDIVEGIVSSRSTKPSVDSVVKQIASSPQAFLKALAARLLEDVDSLTDEQLDFIVTNAPDLAGRAAPLLYRRALEVGARHVVESLRHLWNVYGKPTPITCPRCGFRSVAPNLTCMVCGAVLDESEVKESVRFKELISEFAEKADPALVQEVLRAGFVLLNHEVNPPSLRASLSFYVELYLSSEEKRMVKSILEKRTADSGRV